MLIRADDILEHYNTLRKHHKELAYIKVFEGFSHIDFTYMSHHSMISDIMNALKTVINRDDENLESESSISN
jgi:hypothetical protein